MSPGCASIDPNAGISANNAYRNYRPAPPSTAAVSQVAAELPGILRSIQAHPPITERTVDDQHVTVDGLSGDGGCLPLLGH